MEQAYGLRRFTSAFDLMNEEINNIIKEQYGNFQGRKMIRLGKVHEVLRKRLGDEQYLKYLREQVINNPRPVYKHLK
jgi:hypothetical protein